MHDRIGLDFLNIKSNHLSWIFEFTNQIKPIKLGVFNFGFSDFFGKIFIQIYNFFVI